RRQTRNPARLLPPLGSPLAVRHAGRPTCRPSRRCDCKRLRRVPLCSGGVLSSENPSPRGREMLPSPSIPPERIGPNCADTYIKTRWSVMSATKQQILECLAKVRTPDGVPLTEANVLSEVIVG